MIQQIQKEIARWESTSCPNVSAEDKLIGMMEELGELAHANFKRRIMKRDTDVQEIDSIGDITIFLMGYCNEREIDFCEAVRTAWNVVKKRNNIPNEEDL